MLHDAFTLGLLGLGVGGFGDSPIPYSLDVPTSYLFWTRVNWIKGSQIEKYESLSNASRIKNSNLDPAHALFLAVIHKIFFQHGGGREEKSLLKGGFGQKYDSKLPHKILNILLREKLIERHLGDDGYIYGPIRRHTRRISAIKGQLALSEDPLWAEIGKL